MTPSKGSDNVHLQMGVSCPDCQSLLEQVHRLTHEVQRLIKIERKLYNTQQRMDEQVRHYRAINDVGKLLNQALDIKSVLDVITEFVLYDINLERCLILLEDIQDQTFKVQAVEGYYDDQQFKSIGQLKIPKSQFQPEDLFFSTDHVICSETCSTAPLLQLRQLFLMHEYIFFSLGDEQGSPMCLLVAGNTQAMMPYQTRIDVESDLISCLLSLAHQASTAVKKALFYDTLQSQKHELENALMALNKKNIRLEKALQDLDEAHIKATRDSLTGLFNRAYFDERFAQEVTQAQLNQSEIVLALIDLDFFKSINDSYGHLVGDLVLQQFGKLLQEQTPLHGIPCRYGGEEFAVILPGLAPAISLRPDRCHSALLPETGAIHWPAAGSHHPVGRHCL
jgi:GGDEF domain-containing protein